MILSINFVWGALCVVFDLRVACITAHCDMTKSIIPRTTFSTGFLKSVASRSCKEGRSFPIIRNCSMKTYRCTAVWPRVHSLVCLLFSSLATLSALTRHKVEGFQFCACVCLCLCLISSPVLQEVLWSNPSGHFFFFFRRSGIWSPVSSTLASFLSLLFPSFMSISYHHSLFFYLCYGQYFSPCLKKLFLQQPILVFACIGNPFFSESFHS